LGAHRKYRLTGIDQSDTQPQRSEREPWGWPRRPGRHFHPNMVADVSVRRVMLP
jgi:hypothetical protein